MIISSIIGMNIAKIRELKNLSQKELSYLANVDRSLIIKIEKGKANPTLYTLDKICTALQIRTEIILDIYL
jgi:putative transcriptional regulator